MFSPGMPVLAKYILKPSVSSSMAYPQTQWAQARGLIMIITSPQ